MSDLYYYITISMGTNYYLYFITKDKYRSREILECHVGYNNILDGINFLRFLVDFMDDLVIYWEFKSLDYKNPDRFREIKLVSNTLSLLYHQLIKGETITPIANLYDILKISVQYLGDEYVFKDEYDKIINTSEIIDIFYYENSDDFPRDSINGFYISTDF
ncbi:hypothetical protein QJ850_gp215 [Acanthamoeba polyphaga mimivirus]|uniref:Uncharacterized protein n=1 Tax=Acanthamoeba polyphaga mimivirus Kroon TaxID=3069720 RepID=A0A0G2Y7B7_9VIRU|nr:hypothetical protein QJ850_gp215 [Acanthamoeba polyphaga mimivirus]AKI80484.1 hypothetical protein [Acanthamoeba polyphaga mimivirus Kroon]